MLTLQLYSLCFILYTVRWCHIFPLGAFIRLWSVPFFCVRNVLTSSLLLKVYDRLTLQSVEIWLNHLDVINSFGTVTSIWIPCVILCSYDVFDRQRLFILKYSVVVFISLQVINYFPSGSSCSVFCKTDFSSFMILLILVPKLTLRRSLYHSTLSQSTWPMQIFGQYPLL